MQVYGLLSVHQEQLSPSRIVLQVDEAGMFSVANVHLRVDSTQDPASDWVSKMHNTVADDIAFVHANPLYNNSCVGKGACPDRHWSCPYILSSLFGGSHVARRTNRRIFLITPGIFMYLVVSFLGNFASFFHQRWYLFADSCGCISLIFCGMENAFQCPE